MLRRSLIIAAYSIIGLSVLILLPPKAFAQEVIPPERIDDWFRSRIIWAPIITAVAGALVGAFHLSRLKVQSHQLQVNNQARRKLGLWLIAVAVTSGVVLFLDVWGLFPFFTSASLTAAEALGQVWLSMNTLYLLLAALAAFFLLVAITTRFRPNSRCPYAFWWGPHGK